MVSASQMIASLESGHRPNSYLRGCRREYPDNSVPVIVDVSVIIRMEHDQRLRRRCHHTRTRFICHRRHGGFGWLVGDNPELYMVAFNELYTGAMSHSLSFDLTEYSASYPPHLVSDGG